MNKTTTIFNRGFTIVELLIVIVVIGILAAITIVAYSGVQNRANDTAVKNDLSVSAKNVELYRVDNGKYPGSYSNLVAMKTVGYPVVASQSAYDTSTNNYAFCFDTTNDGYAIVARSKSGQVWYISDRQASPTQYSPTWTAGVATLCTNVLVSYSNGQWAYQTSVWSTAFL